MGSSRNPSFPACSLKEAVERVEKIYDKEGRHPMSPEAAVAAMGYNSLNGASRTALSALRKYGLVTGRSQDMKLTRDAVHIAVEADADDQGDRRAALRAAFEATPLFAELFERFAGGASETNLRTYLEKEKDADRVAATQAAAIFRESLSYLYSQGVKLSESEDEDREEVDGEDTEDEVAFEDTGKAIRNPPARRDSTGGGGARAPRIKQDTYELHEGPVTFTWPEVMSAEEVDDIADWFEIVKKKLRREVALQEKKAAENEAQTG